MNKTVLVNIENGVASITLDRTEFHNAFNSELIDDLTQAMQSCTNEKSVRLILLQANGTTFSSGADLNWMQDSLALSRQENIDDAKRFANLLKLFKTCCKPTIVKINGPAFGGAIGIISCCDIAIASESSRFCFSEVKVGLIPATISPYIISAIGEKKAKRYFITAEEISPDTAKTIGLVDEVVPSPDLNSYCDNIIEKILSNKPIAVNEAKKLVNTVLSLSKDDDISEITANLIANIRISTEAQHALQAFLAKRKRKSKEPK